MKCNKPPGSSSHQSGTGRAAFEVHGNFSEILPGGFPRQDPSPRVPARGQMLSSYESPKLPETLTCCLLTPGVPANVGFLAALG